MSKALEYVRSTVIRWAMNVKDITEFETLPAHIFALSDTMPALQVKLEASTTSVPSVPTTMASAPVRRRSSRVRKHKKQSATAEQIREIREKMEGLTPTDEKFMKFRDGFAKSFGLSRRQISAIANGVDRAHKRKRTMGKK